MAEVFQVLLFGDETADFRGPLQKLCQGQNGVLFSQFICRLSHVLHDEVRRLPHHAKKLIPPFTDISDLVNRYHESTSRTQVLETTLTCICQVGSIFRCAFGDPTSSVELEK